MIAPKKDENQGRATRRGRAGEQKPLRMWTLIGGVAVAAVALVVFLMISDSGVQDGELDDGNGKKVGLIDETSPVLTMRPEKTPEEIEAEEKDKSKPLPPQRVGELRDGYRLLPDGTLHRVLGIVTNTPPKMSLADKTFTHSADVELGNLLMVEPGDDLLGDSEGLYRGFGKELDEALAEPIYYDKDDTDVQRELKEGVNELREELKRRRAAGEDIEKLMEDTRNQLKELSLYRQELEDQVRNLSTDDLTQQDYEDLLNAANQMLEERGIKPLEVPATLKRAIRIRQIQENAAKKEKEVEHENND